MKRKPFTTQLDPKLTDPLRKIAEEKGRKLYSVLEEAISDYLKKGK